ncbi:hypothetical protein OG936_13575 [Streptomyces sp. NBC_00846]|uniref:hypothetical protein n=1 Tax=Streptomyces sp. NBC_00846 TaxID=2975849 RepID=UPI00386E97D9|nr:hypothetical protein OG936_13575 [Streptomyces sp. NBC_00846]
MAPQPPTDLRTEVLDLLSLTPEARLCLAGLACARCGSTEALRPGGHAYTRSPGGGRLGWAVQVCMNCPANPSQERELRS